jgi:hypothetical protein
LRTRRSKIILVTAVVAIIALAVGLTIWLTSDGSSNGTTSHADYARLYNAAVVGKTKIDVVDQWPKPPYQDFRDGSGNHCFEWFDKPKTGGGTLYDLCFNKAGVLVSTNTP